jgi:type IV pilus assembly protein PilC
MPSTFQYKVRDREGRIVEGNLEGDSQSLVADKLKQMGYVPISITTKETGGLSRDLSFGGFGGVKLKDVAVFSRQFATMINSGLPLVRSLGILSEQTESKPLAAAITQVRLDVERGASLSQAIATHPKAFSNFYVAMVRAGETGGVLDAVLLELANTIERQLELRRKIKSAMTYPIAVLGLVLIIMTAMLVVVVPKFKSLFASVNSKLPLPTQVLVNASNFVRGNFLFIVAGIIGLVFGFKAWKKTPEGRSLMDRFKLRVPIMGRLVHKTAVARFARSLAVLMKAGVNILVALEITSATVDNTVIEKAMDEVQAAVQVGEPISVPMSRNKIFPSMVTQMVAVGEETGTVDDMLGKVADFFESEVSAAVEGLTAMLEPILMGFLGGAVGTMVVALYMPMFDIITKVK